MDIFHAGLYGYLSLAIILLVSFSVSYLFYRKTETGDFKKAALVFLRTASLFFILTLFLNPFITSKPVQKSESSDIILVDNSLSMNLEKRYESLSSAADGIKKLSSGYRIYGFGSGLLNEIKSGGAYFTGSEYRTYSTDLADALEELYSMRGDFGINSISIVSDGIINEKGNLISAAKKFGVPFYYSLTGDTVQKNDVLIKNILYNRNAFAGGTTTIKVIVNSYGYSKNLNVNLYEEGILMQTKSLLVNKQESVYSTEFKVTSGIPGVRKYSVRTDTLENEITTLNNERDFFIKYSGNKFRVLVIAGSPGADYSAFKQSLSGLENFTADFFTGKTPDSFYEGGIPPIKGYDVLVLFGFPAVNTDKNLTDRITSDAAVSGIPVIFFNTSNTGYENLKSTGNILPFTVSNPVVSGYLSAARMLPFDAPDEPEPIRKISMLPPVYFSKGTFTPKPGASVLGVTTAENEPAVLLYNDGKTRSAAFLGYGIYKWTLNNSGESGNTLKDLSSVLFNLALEGNKRNKFFLTTEKDCFAFSEPIEITAFDGTSGTGGTSVNLKISGNDYSRETGMSRNDASSFRYTFTPDIVSDFSAKGMLFADKDIIADDAIRFSCGKSQEEYINTKPDASILKSLAAATGGTDIRGYGKSSFEKRKSDTVTEIPENKFLFRDSIYWLLAIILLLSAEWFLRKRFNLP